MHDVYYQSASTDSLDGSTMLFVWFTKGRLMQEVNWMMGGSSGYFLPH